jgi:RNA polymerase sigma-70 factor (ECF subfamily)
MTEINTNLIQEAQRGDQAQLSALYEHYHPNIYRYLYYRVGDVHVAEDLTSEVFERMLRFLGSFHPPSRTFPAWLFRIAQNVAIDHFRSNGRRLESPLAEEMAGSTASPESEVERRLNVELLKLALADLTDEQRDVVLLRFVAGMPIAEAAEALNKSDDAVKGLQRRALLALRATLETLEVTYDS